MLPTKTEGKRFWAWYGVVIIYISSSPELACHQLYIFSPLPPTQSHCACVHLGGANQISLFQQPFFCQLFLFCNFLLFMISIFFSPIFQIRIISDINKVGPFKYPCILYILYIFHLEHPRIFQFTQSHCTLCVGQIKLICLTWLRFSFQTTKH